MIKSQAEALLCLDIDGTLTDAQENVHPQDIAILQDIPEQIQLIITTGRNPRSAFSVLQEHNLFSEGRFPLPGVFMNGGVALMPGEHRVVEHLLDPALLADLAEITASFPDTTFAFFGPDEVNLVNPTPFGCQIANRHYFFANEVSPKSIPNRIVKVMAINQDRDSLEAVKMRIRDLPAQMGYTLPYLYEINAPGVNKAATLQVLLRELCMEHLPVFAAGDGENDLALMTLTTRFFAPLSANRTVKDRADEVIDRRQNGILMPVFAKMDSLLKKI